MSAPNYESIWWGYIYDQMMAEGLSDWLDETRRFYREQLRGVRGPVLECACGTGLIMLPLLTHGSDIYGFDISAAMLDSLRKKAAAQGLHNIAERISVQDLTAFSYDRHFAAILIPSNSFSMLTTQEAQISALQRIAAHLAPGGRLLLDLRLAGMRGFDEDSLEIIGNWHTWSHPETGLPIRQRVTAQHDLDNQLVLDRCTIEYDGVTVDFPMTGRWIYKSEFQLLLRLAGFTRWECFGSPKGAPLEIGLDEVFSYWVAWKE
jgi:SAM-dependent methyltransferase